MSRMDQASLDAEDAILDSFVEKQDWKSYEEHILGKRRKANKKERRLENRE